MLHRADLWAMHIAKGLLMVSSSVRCRNLQYNTEHTYILMNFFFFKFGPARVPNKAICSHEVEVQLAEMSQPRRSLTDLEYHQVREELRHRIKQVSELESQEALHEHQVMQLQESLKLVDCECNALRQAVVVSAEREEKLCSQLQQETHERIEATTKVQQISQQLQQAECEIIRAKEIIKIQRQDCCKSQAVRIDKYTQYDLLNNPLEIANDLSQFRTTIQTTQPTSQDPAEYANNQFEYEETKQDQEFVKPSKETQTVQIQGPGLLVSQLRYQLSLAYQQLAILIEKTQPLASQAHLITLELQADSARTEIAHLTQQLQLAEKQNRKYAKLNDQLFVRLEGENKQLQVLRLEHARQLNQLQEEIIEIKDASEKQSCELRKYQKLANKQQVKIDKLKYFKSRSQLLASDNRVLRNSPHAKKFRSRTRYRRTIVKILFLSITSRSMFHFVSMKVLFATLFHTRTVEAEYSFLYI